MIIIRLKKELILMIDSLLDFLFQLINICIYIFHKWKIDLVFSYQYNNSDELNFLCEVFLIVRKCEDMNHLSNDLLTLFVWLLNIGWLCISLSLVLLDISVKVVLLILVTPDMAEQNNSSLS